MRALVCCLLLAGCAGISDAAPPSSPGLESLTDKVLKTGLRTTATEAKLTGPLEYSAVKPASPVAPGSPGAQISCVREAAPTGARRAYAVFFRGNAVFLSRLAVMIDDCSTETYSPL